MEIEIKKVNSFICQHIPPEDTTIETDFYIDKMAPFINALDVYLFEKIDKDTNEIEQAEWRIDIELDDNTIFRIVLPKEMTELRIKEFVQPLITLKNQNRKDLH